MKTNEKKCSKNLIRNILLFAILVSVIALALSFNVSAKVWVIQNQSVDMFVVNGSSGNIILNPNAGFGNVGIGTNSKMELL